MDIEEKKIKKIYRNFTIIDTIAALGCVTLYFIDIYERSYLTFTLYGCIDPVIACLLGVSAFYLTKFIRNKTGKKPNTCLLNLHIINMLILATLEIIKQLIYVEY